jgi:cell division protein FtsA
MKNMEKAFSMFTHIEKIRTAKYVTMTINSSNEAVKTHDGRMNTALGLLAKGYLNCAGTPIDQNRDLFEEQNPVSNQPDRTPRQTREITPGVIITEQEEKMAEEEARRKREAEEQLRREQEEREREAEERERRENSWFNKFKKRMSDFTNKLTEDE